VLDLRESQSLPGNWWPVLPGGRGSRRAATWRFGHDDGRSLSCGGRPPRSRGEGRTRPLRWRLGGSLALPFGAAIQRGEFPDRLSVEPGGRQRTQPYRHPSPEPYKPCLSRGNLPCWFDNNTRIAILTRKIGKVVVTPVVGKRWVSVGWPLQVGRLGCL